VRSSTTIACRDAIHVRRDPARRLPKSPSRTVAVCPPHFVAHLDDLVASQPSSPSNTSRRAVLGEQPRIHLQHQQCALRVGPGRSHAAGESRETGEEQHKPTARESHGICPLSQEPAS
jgi:hypothetical protein